MNATRFLKAKIERMFNLVGYEIRKLGRVHADAFADQVALLRPETVRTIFDIGANVGQTAATYSKLFPSATIYSFEPFADSFNQLSRDAAVRWPRVRPFQLAITDSVGQVSLHVNADSVTNSVLPTSAAAHRHMDEAMLQTTSHVQVPSNTLDAFCKEQLIDQIDLLKVDVQGSELQVLRGAADMLERHAIGVIFSEVDFAEFYQGQTCYYDLFQHLEQRGYRLYGLYNLTYGKPNSPIGWGDAIFVSKRIEERLASRNDF